MPDFTSILHRKVTAIVQEESGDIWFATFGGLSRYDGEYFVNYTVADGLPIDEIECLIPAEDGKLWYGTWGGGVGYYDGEHFVNFSTEDGLPGSTVRAMLKVDPIIKTIFLETPKKLIGHHKTPEAKPLQVVHPPREPPTSGPTL